MNEDKSTMDSRETLADIPLDSLDVANIIHLDPNQKELFLKPCGGPIGDFLSSVRKSVVRKLGKKSNILCQFIKVLVIVLVLVYIGFLISHFINTGYKLDWCGGYGKAFIYIAFVTWCIIYYKGLKKIIRPPIKSFTNSKVYVNKVMYVKYIVYIGFIVGFLVFVVYDTSNNRRRLVSLLGIVFFLFISVIFSKYPQYIRWDTVLSGAVLQMILGLTAIRWDTGRNILKCIGDNVVTFLDFGLEGAVFVYGDFLINKQMVFAFQALSTLYFLAMVARMLFYLGWLQKFCFKIGGFVEALLGTTVIESVNAATIIFLGMSEAPLLYSVYLADLTASEIHAIMTSGFSTVAGTLLAAYASMGVDPRYVITASVMAAPASLCFAKLLYPETTESRTTSKGIQLLKSDDKTLLQAASNGASSAIGMIQGIIASVVSCIAFIAFLNGVCSWLGTLVGLEDITLEYLVGLLFFPIAWLMGVKPEECQSVASLIGIKTMANEFVAYKKLGELKREGKLSVRSEAIATFALCAFSNPASLGSNIATLSALEKRQSENVNKVAFRAFIAGCITTFTSACIAGLLTEEDVWAPHLNSTLTIGE